MSCIIAFFFFCPICPTWFSVAHWKDVSLSGKVEERLTLCTLATQQLQDALCSTLFPCCTTVAAATSSAIMKGHRSAGPSPTSCKLHPFPVLPLSKAPRPDGDTSCFSPLYPACRQDGCFNKGYIESKCGCLCVIPSSAALVMDCEGWKMAACRSKARVCTDITDVPAFTGYTAAIKAPDKIKLCSLDPCGKNKVPVTSNTGEK